MEMKPFYKQTEVGVIPNDWDVKRLIDCCDYADYRGKTPPKTASGTFLITARNIREGFIDYNESQEFVATEQYDMIMRRGKPKIGDVLITTEAPLGNVAQVDREDVALAQRIIKYRPKNAGLVSDYLKHYLLSDRFQRTLDEKSSGSTAKGIKGSLLHQLPVVIPQPIEQKSIARALNDADALIDSLEQLVAKKRQIKHGAMQELLTGQKRLPGFATSYVLKKTDAGLVPNDWLDHKVGELIEFVGGSQPDKSVFRSSWKLGYIRLIQIRDYKTDRFETYIPRDLSRRFCTEEDIMIGRYGPPVFQILRGIAGSYNVALIKARPLPPIDREFAYYFLKQEKLFAFIEKLSQRSSGQTGVDLKELRAYPLPLPPTRAEQEAIAAVLSDMDADIAALESKLVKVRLVKRGMMQVLLTGRIRLVNPREATS